MSVVGHAGKAERPQPVARLAGEVKKQRHGPDREERRTHPQDFALPALNARRVISGVRCSWVGMNMSSCETLVQATELIVSEGCYFGIFDSASPVNCPGKWCDEFQAAKRMAGEQEWSALFHLNQSWIDLAGEGALLSWITLFDGVFKVEVRILAEKPKIEFSEEDREQFLGEAKENLLYCPSGNIVVDCLTRLGSNSVCPLVTITPGRYRVGFVRNDDEERKHQFLEGENLYPANDGPDWIIHMQREG